MVAVDLLFYAELPALGVRCQLKASVCTGRTLDRAVELLKECICTVALELEEFSCNLNLNASEETLEKFRADAASSLAAWESKLQAAEECKARGERATATLKQMREAYFKELSLCREQLFQKERAEQQSLPFLPAMVFHFDPVEYEDDNKVLQLVKDAVQCAEQRHEAEKQSIRAHRAEMAEQLRIARLNLACKEEGLFDKGQPAQVKTESVGVGTERVEMRKVATQTDLTNEHFWNWRANSPRTVASEKDTEKDNASERLKRFPLSRKLQIQTKAPVTPDDKRYWEPEKMLLDFDGEAGEVDITSLISKREEFNLDSPRVCGFREGGAEAAATLLGHMPHTSGRVAPSEAGSDIQDSNGTSDPEDETLAGSPGFAPIDVPNALAARYPSTPGPSTEDILLRHGVAHSGSSCSQRTVPPRGPMRLQASPYRSTPIQRLADEGGEELCDQPGSSSGVQRKKSIKRRALPSISTGSASQSQNVKGIGRKAARPKRSMTFACDSGSKCDATGEPSYSNMETPRAETTRTLELEGIVAQAVGKRPPCFEKGQTRRSTTGDGTISPRSSFARGRSDSRRTSTMARVGSDSSEANISSCCSPRSPRKTELESSACGESSCPTASSLSVIALKPADRRDKLTETPQQQKQQPASERIPSPASSPYKLPGRQVRERLAEQAIAARKRVSAMAALQSSE